MCEARQPIGTARVNAPWISKRTGLFQQVDDAVQAVVGDVRQPRGAELGDRLVGGHGDGTPGGRPRNGGNHGNSD